MFCDVVIAFVVVGEVEAFVFGVVVGNIAAFEEVEESYCKIFNNYLILVIFSIKNVLRKKRKLMLQFIVFKMLCFNSR